MRLFTTAALAASLALTTADASAQGTTLWSVDGAAGFTGIGAAVASTGDIDSDGIPDLITSTAGASTESVLVLSGTGNFPLVVLSSSIPGNGFGASLSSLGDLNGNGSPEVLIGTPFDNGGAGSVMVFDPLSLTVLYGATLPGSGASENLGWSVTGLGDLTGDGVPEFAAGGIGGGTGGGIVRVYNGATGANIVSLTAPNPASVFGISVACAGDINGDGVSDLIVGDQQDPTAGVNAGSVRVYSGAVLGTGSTAAQLQAWFGSAGDLLGRSVARAGDTNGNGIPDIVAGAIQSGSGFPGNTGSLVLFDGNGTLLRTIYGDAFNDAFGYSVAGGGDYDGDGRSDVAAVSPAGYARVFSGANGNLLADLSTSASSQTVDFSGDLGCGTATLDLSGEGFAELIVGDTGGGTAGAGVVEPVSGVDPALDIDGVSKVLSLAAGGSYHFALDAGPANAGKLYWIFGSLSGTAGVPISGRGTLPLTFDAYTNLLLTNPNAFPMSGNLGVLDANGRSTAASFLVPAGGGGLPLANIHHAYILVDPVSGAITYTSMAAPLSLVP